MGSAMISAAVKGHWGKPIWSSKGGAELAVSLLSAAAVAGTVGPGAYSVDSLLGIRVPKWITGLTVVGSVLLLAEAIHPTVAPKFAVPPATDTSGEEAE
jgi:hypothetical protein